MADKLKCIFLLVALIVAGCGPSQPPEDVVISLGGEEWIMELATHPDEIRAGLMNRPSINPGTGMIFIFPESRIQSFWMAYCLTDIDLVFVDGTGRITATHAMEVEPPRSPSESEQAYLGRMQSYGSIFPARVAIELPPGSIEKLGLASGQATGLNMRALEDLRRRSATNRRQAESPVQP